MPDVVTSFVKKRESHAMRMRRKKHARERIERCGQLFLADPKAYRGKWQELFGNSNPIMLEIGCGKGSFIAQTATQNPDINYIAIEKCVDCLVIAVERAATLQLPNVRFIDCNAEVLEEIFLPGECKRIFLNFSDPWPKVRQAKRRLPHSRFLRKYWAVLDANGAVFLKTDNIGLFEFAIAEFLKEDWKLSDITYDLHNSGFMGNVMTEYEINFTQKGIPICRLEARKI
jgi:tRNA (guanine-N7-)-methyltransferase